MLKKVITAELKPENLVDEAKLPKTEQAKTEVKATKLSDKKEDKESTNDSKVESKSTN